MIQLWRDPSNDKWRLKQFELADGSYDHCLPLDDAVKPEALKDLDHGTMVLLLGKDRADNTMEPPAGVDNRAKWIIRYLNQRYFRFPTGVEVRVREGWEEPRENSKRNFLRRAKGQDYFLKQASTATGANETVFRTPKSRPGLIGSISDHKAEAAPERPTLVRQRRHAGGMEVFGGALLGGVIGVVVAELVRVYQGPRVKFLGLESTQPERGLAGGEQYLRRIRFEVRGSSAGTATSIQLRWGSDVRQATYAKWDETPEPVEQNPVTKEWGNPPNLVPSTFFLPLYAEEQYTVPVLIDYELADGARLLDVFCGWWYIENQPAKYRLRVTKSDTIKIKIQGMPWVRGWLRPRKSEKTFRVADLQAAPLRREQSPERGGRP